MYFSINKRLSITKIRKYLKILICWIFRDIVRRQRLFIIDNRVAINAIQSRHLDTISAGIDTSTGSC